MMDTIDQIAEREGQAIHMLKKYNTGGVRGKKNSGMIRRLTDYVPTVRSKRKTNLRNNTKKAP